MAQVEQTMTKKRCGECTNGWIFTNVFDWIDDEYVFIRQTSKVCSNCGGSGQIAST